MSHPTTVASNRAYSLFLDFKIYGAYPPNTKSLQSYWENIYNAEFDPIPSEDFDWDARQTIFNSWRRRNG